MSVLVNLYSKTLTQLSIDNLRNRDVRMTVTQNHVAGFSKRYLLKWSTV